MPSPGVRSSSPHVLLVQVLNDDEATAAQRWLQDAQYEGNQVRGLGGSAEIEALEHLGLRVEIVPADASMCWLEPDVLTKSNKPVADLIAGCIQRPVPSGSLLMKLIPANNLVYLIQFVAPPFTKWLDDLNRLDVKLLAHVPHFAYKAWLSDEQRDEVRALPFVRRVVQFTPEMTLWPLSAARVKRAASQEIDAKVTVEEEACCFEVSCHEDKDISTIVRVLRDDSRATEVEEGACRIRFRCPPESLVLTELAFLPQVSSLDEFEPPRLNCDWVRRAFSLDSGVAGIPPACRWDGTGQIVGVADSGVDRTHPDLIDRIDKVIERATAGLNDPFGHGTHVSGIIAGTGAQSGGTVRGIAPGSKLVVQSLCDKTGKLSGIPVSLGEMLQESYGQGVRIHNNSWGANAQGRYTPNGYEIDKFVHEHPDMLVVVAAGNKGQLSPSGVIAYQSLESPGEAKNALTVGAATSNRTAGPYQNATWQQYGNGYCFDQPPVRDELIAGTLNGVAAFSSRGPIDYGGVKPDLVAPGTVIRSAKSSATDPAGKGGKDYYRYDSGTSMATAVVSGAAALVRQFYVDERKHTPSAALLKATLINGTVWVTCASAQDSTVGQPNFHQGFGRLDFTRVLPGLIPNMKLLFVDIGRDDNRALHQKTMARWLGSIHVKAGLPLSITLCWTDLPDRGLQQNLDLVINLSDGSRICGNESHRREPWQQSDKTNNVERVWIEKPAAGKHDIYVLAETAFREKQGFSLVISGELNSPEIE